MNVYNESMNKSMSKQNSERQKVCEKFYAYDCYSRIINHHGTPVKVNNNGEILKPIKKNSVFFVKNFINNAFEVWKQKRNLDYYKELRCSFQNDVESSSPTPLVSDILKEKKINPMDLISRNETVSLSVIRQFIKQCCFKG